MIRMIRNFKNYKKALRYIAQHLSEENLAEIKAYDPEINVEKALIETAMESAHGFFCFDLTGNPRAVGGVFSDGNVWFVVTAGLTQKEIIPWLKKARRITKELCAVHQPLWGFWCTDNKLSQLWMRWCGFDFAQEDSPANYEIGGKKFIYFQN